MTVIFSKKCELAIQAVLYLSSLDEGQTASAAEIAEKMKVPRDFVSKVLQILTYHSISASRKGKNGGFYLAKKPNEIKLLDIVIAIDGNDVFNKCVLGFPGCGTGKPCPVHQYWGKLREQTLEMLSNQNLEELRDLTINKIESL